MPHWLKWILVLPAAIGAFVGVQILVVAGSLFLDSGSGYAQFASALLCPAAFVSAGSRVAPVYRHITAICLTILVAILSTAIVTKVVMDRHETRSGLAWLVICGVAGIVVCVFECHSFNEEEPAQGSRSRERESSPTVKPSSSRFVTYSGVVVIAILAIFVWLSPKHFTGAYTWLLKSYSNIAIAKSQPLSPVELFQTVSPSVFVVEALDENGKSLMLGSGVALARDFLITNCHVVQSGSSLRVSRGKEMWTARLIQAAPSHDLCGLRPSGLTLQPVGVRPSSKLATGEHVYAIGSPEGLELTFSEGIISALRETEGVHMIQTSAPVSPGSSGGGLFDAQGNLVGITSFQLREGQSLNFALPGEWVIDSLSHSNSSTGSVNSTASDAELESRAWIGIGLEAIKKEDYGLAASTFRKSTDLKQSYAFQASFELGKIFEKSSEPTTSRAYEAWLCSIASVQAKCVYGFPGQATIGEAETRAIAWFEKAIELKPDYAEAWLELARTHQQRKEYDQAISAAKEATRLAPGDWNGWLDLGRYYIETKSYAEAIAALQQAEKVAPLRGDTVAPNVQKGIVLTFLGEAYAKRGDRKQVLRIYQELKNTNPRIAEDFLREYVLPTRGDNTPGKPAPNGRVPALGLGAPEYKRQIEEFIVAKGLSGCISVHGTGNTLVISGMLRPAGHGALLKFLREAPSGIRVVDQIRYEDSPDTPCR